MPDLLAHVLIAYIIGQTLSWCVDWLSPPYVTVVMAGAFIPDLTKVSLLVSNATVRTTFGVPFDWFALHTLGGSLVSVAIGVVLVADRERWRVAALLGIGAASHLIADLFLISPSGRSYPILWPLSRLNPEVPELYLSTDPKPMLVLALVACGLFVISHVRTGQSDQ